MKVIFLDVDGVLNSDEYCIASLKERSYDDILFYISEEKIELLKKAIVATGAKVVLTTSWRYREKSIPFKKLLAQHGILPDSTPYLGGEKGLEIKKWLIDNEGVEDFVILDDEIYATYDEKLLKKLIKISYANGRSFGEGLLPKDVEEIIKRLGKVKNKKEENER